MRVVEEEKKGKPVDYVEEVIEQNQKIKKKEISLLIRAISTAEEIEKKIVEYLVVKKNDRRKLICINP